MSFFDKASLVTIPTAYKVGKLYSVKPSSGDFTFTRSTSATRVNEAGLIEKERENLLLQSNTFNTTWTTSQASLTGGQTGYDGSNDGWLLESTVTGSSFVRQLVDVSSSVSTLSIYAKSGNVDWCYINAVGVTAYYDLSNGIVGTATGTNLIDTNIESVGNGWYRISITGLGISQERIYPATTNGNPDSAVGDNIYIQDAQLEAGLVATDYIETTTSTVATGITTNVPRIDYSSGTPALLLEPQRTNLFYYSEYSEYAGINVTREYVESPDGFTNALRVYETAANGQHFTPYRGSVVAGQTYSLSFFIKKGSYDEVKVYTQSVYISSIFTITFSTNNLTFTGSDIVPNSQKLENYGNGWYRVSGTVIPNTSGNFFIYAVVKDLTTYVGDPTKYTDYYGFQVEQGAYATSYIPTYGTSVTRISDYVSTLTSVSTNGIINNYNTTVFVELQKVYNTGLTRFITLFASGGVLNPRVIIYKVSTNIYVQYRVSGQSDVVIIEPNIDFDTTNKICCTINNTTLKLFVNGVLVGSEPIVQGDPIEDLDLVENIADIGYLLSKVITFPTALTDAECIELTTL